MDREGERSRETPGDGETGRAEFLFPLDHGVCGGCVWRVCVEGVCGGCVEGVWRVCVESGSVGGFDAYLVARDEVPKRPDQRRGVCLVVELASDL